MADDTPVNGQITDAIAMTATPPAGEQAAPSGSEPGAGAPAGESRKPDGGVPAAAASYDAVLAGALRASALQVGVMAMLDAANLLRNVAAMSTAAIGAALARRGKGDPARASADFAADISNIAKGLDAAVEHFDKVATTAGKIRQDWEA